MEATFEGRVSLPAGLPAVSTRAYALVRWAVLFVAAALPLLVVEVPPLQDLPNHLATLTVLQHPEQFPEYVANGFLKTNAALYLWLFAATKVMSAALAAKLFVAGVLALGAFTFPRVVDRLAGEATGRVAALFVWPFVHNFFVSVGMLDYALGVPLALEVLLAMQVFREAPGRAAALRVTALALATWYAHVFALLVVGLLATIELGLEAARARSVRPMLPLALLVPAAAPSVGPCLAQLHEQSHPLAANLSETVFLPPWELAYNLWAECAWGFTWRSLSSLLVAVPFFLGVWRWRRPVPFFSPAALVVLALAYCFTPYVATNWFYFNTRFAPFLWVALLVRMPERMPRAVTAFAAACAVLYYAGMAADYRILDRERTAFVAARAEVPRGAQLLPLVFDSKGASENTRPLLHAWGYYVTDRETSAPLLFAHSRQFAVSYREAPPEQLNHLLLERVPQRFGERQAACAMLKRAGVAQGCDELYADFWSGFWANATPHFDHVLLWSPPPEAVAAVPSSYKLRSEHGALKLFVRDDAWALHAAPTAAR
jgi:hypothetical protein